MIQDIIIGICFAFALFYLVRIVYKQFTAKSNCETGCGKCSTIDFQKIEQQLRSKGEI